MILSVIVPVYNVEKYLDECIDSILHQSLKEFELILIDDGSTDKSGLICDKWANADERVRVFHVTNQGVSTARNLGIQYANGKYIQFVDSDDVLNLNAFEIALKKIEENDLLIFGYETFPEGKKLNFELQKNYLCVAELAEDYLKLEKKHILNSPCNKVYKREIIKKNNIQFSKNISLGEDLLFNLSYIQYCSKMLIIPDILYNYRRNINGSLSVRFKEENLSIFRLLKEEVDKTFNNDSNVVACTTEVYCNQIVETLKSCVYSENVKRKDKFRILDEWVKNDYFQSKISNTYRGELKVGMFFKHAIKRKNSVEAYYILSIRKVISTWARKIKKFFK